MKLVVVAATIIVALALTFIGSIGAAVWFSYEPHSDRLVSMLTYTAVMSGLLFVVTVPVAGALAEITDEHTSRRNK